jgi:hypothetical protein
VTLVDAIKRIDEVDQREAAQKYIDLDLVGRTSDNSTKSTDSMFNCMNSLILKNTILRSVLLHDFLAFVHLGRFFFQRSYFLLAREGHRGLGP